MPPKKEKKAVYIFQLTKKKKVYWFSILMLLQVNISHYIVFLFLGSYQWTRVS
jgi:hypothetical protein